MKRKGYISYLLRMWQVDDEQEHTWRASLECPASRERRGFATLEELFHFLQDQAGWTGPGDGALSDGQPGDDEQKTGPETGP